MTRSRPAEFALRVLITVGAAVLVTGCYGGRGHGGSVDGPAAPGGDGTVVDQGTGAFSLPAANLSESDRALFRIGDSFFSEPWTPACEGHEDRDGLGPTFLTTSCAGCHVADGRDNPPTLDGAFGTPIVRFSDFQGHAVELDNYRVQLQPHAIWDVPAEERSMLPGFSKMVRTAMAQHSPFAVPL